MYQRGIQFGLNEAVVFAYTQKVLWQIYSPSAPFRETNSEPEIFIIFPTPENIDKKSGLKGVRFAFVHEFNGRSGLQSRSWNHLYIESLWHRIEEDVKNSPEDFDESKGAVTIDYNRHVNKLSLGFSFSRGLF